MNITFNNFSVSKQEFPILKDLNLTLEHGNCYGVVGIMGSGKTTFLESIAGKVFPKRGKLIKGDKIEFVPADYKFHRFIGAVYQYYQQRYHAYDSEIGPTLEEVLQNRVKPIGTIDEKSVDLNPPLYSESHLTKVCKLFRIDYLLERKITSLSTGETRRSLIVRSVLKNPSWLLLDNPFTGLDKESRKELKKNLISLKRKGIGIIIVGSPNDLESIVDEWVVIYEGHVFKEIDIKPWLSKFKLDPKIDLRLINKLQRSQNENFEIAMQFTNCSVNYEEKQALKDFTWQVKKGEKWALMGPNGSGKSTILSLVTADNPQAYKNDIILFDRKRGSGESIWDIKRKIGFVSAELQLYFDRNIKVWKIVASGLFDTLGLFKALSAEQEQDVKDYIQLLGLQNIQDRRLSQLSSGEKRLVFLARALVKNPPLLILDEPCQGLDYSQMSYFRDLLNQLVIAFDKTMVYVTHYEEEIPKCVNKRLDIDEGMIVN